MARPEVTGRKIGSASKRWIGTAEVAAICGCHLMSVPRFVRTKSGFPQPIKPFGKNLWDEAEVDAYLAALAGDGEDAA